MQEQEKTMAATELLEKLGLIAAEVFAIGIEEDDDEIKAFKDVIGIAGRARELPGETADKVLADTASLMEAIRNTEPGKEQELITATGKWARERDKDAEKQIIQALTETAELVTQPDERKRIDGLISYLKDYFDSPV